MGHPQLDNLARIGQLKIEPAAERELQGLVRSGIRRLDDAARRELSLESRFDLAYNAAHTPNHPNAVVERPQSRANHDRPSNRRRNQWPISPTAQRS